jgi:hypothetical protein
LAAGGGIVRAHAGLAIAAAAVVMSGATAAAEVRQLGPHVHGVSTLDIAVEGQLVSLALESPGADIVGFENAPVGDEQKAALTRAEQTLARPLDLFALPANARCSTVSATSEQVFLNEQGPGPAAGGEGSPIDRYIQQAQHSNFEAASTIHCDRPDAVTGIDFRFFEAFPAAQVVRVQLVTARGQFAFDVARSQPYLPIAGGL